MAVALSDYTKNHLWDWWFRADAWSVPATMYWRLFTTSPNWATGSGGTELSGTGYTQYGNDCTINTFWAQPASQGSYGGYRLTNTGTTGGSDVTWTAGSDWSAITGVGLYDGNLVGSNLIMGGAWSADPGNGDTVRISSGAIDIDLDVSSNGVGITSYLINQFLRKVGGFSTDTPPSNLYVRLYTTVPNVKTGSGGTEVSGTNYAAANVASPFSDASSGGDTQNAAQIDYPTAGSGGWGSVAGAAITDATPTNYYAVDAFSSAVQMDANDDFYIADGAFHLNFSDTV